MSAKINVTRDVNSCPSCGSKVAEGVPHDPPNQDARISVRLTSAQLARAKRNHAAGFAKHGLSWSAWVVARLMAGPK